jgi:antitoxin PrlF
MKKRKPKATCSTSGEDECCCGVKSIITIDERGQIVLPKEVREEADIKAGDKFAVITLKRESKVCCVYLMRVDELSEMVKVKLTVLGKTKKE